MSWARSFARLWRCAAGAFLVVRCVSCGAGEGTIAPGQPSDGPGGSDYEHAAATRTKVLAVESIGSTDLDVGFVLHEPAVPAVPRGPIQVVLFLHGGVFSEEEPHLAHLEHLVRHGYFVVYPTGWWLPHDQNAVVALRALRAALARLAEKGYADPAVSFVGFSSGAMVAMRAACDASTRAALGLPAPRAIVAMDAAGGNSPLFAWLKPTHLAFIPATTRLTFILSEPSFREAMAEPTRCDKDWSRSEPSSACGAWSVVKSAWKSAVQIPREGKTAVVVPSDAFPRDGAPAVRLVSDHQGCTSGSIQAPLDAIDWYGYWKTVDLALGLAHGRYKASADPGSLQDVLTDMGRYRTGDEVLRMSVISAKLD